MIEATFTRELRALCSSRGRGKKKSFILDAEKIKAADPELLHDLVIFLLEQGAPVAKDLAEYGKVDPRILQGCAYFYSVQGKEFVFLCNEENKDWIDGVVEE